MKKNTAFLYFFFYKKKKIKQLIITAFLIFFCSNHFLIFAENSSSENLKITLNRENAELESVLNDIERITDVLFVYNNDVNINRKVSINAKNMPLLDVLNELFDETIQFSVESSYIILSPSKAKKENLFEKQQQRIIKGTIVDSHNESIIGANIIEKGTNNGTISDINGAFILELKSTNPLLIVSYIGFKNQEIRIENEDNYKIKLVEDSETLDEVIVVGYGVQKKSDLTGSIASLSQEVISSVPATDISSALQGQIPGLLSSTTSWNPGDSPEILIRGKRSINASNEPLYVVDGIPMTSSINTINQHDIESIEVLKDASATAIYGSRGANGVILVTTKQGKEGKTIIDYNGYIGIQTIQNRVKMMNGGEYAEYTREAYRNSTRANKYLSDSPDMEQDKLLPMFKQDSYVLESVLTAYDSNGNYNPNKVRYHDWFNDISQDAIITNHSINIRGGGEKTSFMTSASYNYTDGVIKDKSYERYTIRLNLDHSINNYVSIGTQSQYASSIQQRGSGMETDSYLYRITPLGRFINEDGTLPLLIGSDAQMYNPQLNLKKGVIDRPLKNTQYLGNFYLNIKFPIDGLSFRSNLGLDFLSVQDYEYYAKETTSRQNGTSFAKNATSHRKMYTWENYFTYNKFFNDKHSLNLTLLQSIQQEQAESNSSAVENLPSNNLKYYDQAAGLLIKNVGSDYYKWNLASFMGRINYNLLNRYLFTISARYDGSSRLAEGHKWVLFPSAAFAWRIIEEGFMKDTAIDNLKFRLGYGKTGNSAIDPYQTKGTIAKKYYAFGNGATEVIGYTPYDMMNENLTWETTDQWNIGLDFGFLKNRINLTADLYLQNTSDLLLERQLPVVSGFSNVLSNIGKTRNKGVEIHLNTLNVKNSNFIWKTDWIFSFNKQEIVELYNGKVDDIGNTWFIGKPTDVYYDYEKVGIWQNTPEDLSEMEKFNRNGGGFEPGKIRLKDVDGDYKITDIDRVILGNRYPTTMASLNNYFEYLNFDLSISMYANFGGMLKNGFEFMEKPGRANAMQLIDYWTPNNPTNAYPRPSVDQERVDYSNTLGYDKSDFFRIKNITFGYSLNNKIINKIGVSNLRLYMMVNNPYIYTKFTGIDPEGATKQTTPSASTWILGANLSF